MKSFPTLILAVIAALFLSGCKPSETNVTDSSRYHFASFAGTAWTTKVKMELADVKEYNGVGHLYIFVSHATDPKSTEYRPPSLWHIVGSVPVGTRIRVERLMFDNGEGSLLWVTASLDSPDLGAYYGRVVYLDNLLLPNRFIPAYTPPGSPPLTKAWAVNPKYLESASPPRKAKGGEK